MASNPSDSHSDGTLPSSLSSDVVRADQYNTLLERWKDEQRLRLTAEEQCANYRALANVLTRRVHGLETQLTEARDAAQRLRAIL